MKELAKDVEKLDEQQQERVLDVLAGISGAFIASLPDYAQKKVVKIIDENGATHTHNRSQIKTTQLRKLVKVLDDLERTYSNTLYESTIRAMTEAMELTVEHLSSVKGMDVKVDVDVDKELGKKVTIGDKTLEQRVNVVGSNTVSDVRKAIRKGVLAGEDVDDIVSNIRKAFDSTDWQVRRVVESEIYNAYRYQFGKMSDANGFDWIRIHESFPRHPARRKHACYPLANTDKYGKGKGVYKSTDNEIFYPHPQCTSWLEALTGDYDDIKDEVSTEVDEYAD